MMYEYDVQGEASNSALNLSLTSVISTFVVLYFGAKDEESQMVTANVSIQRAYFKFSLDHSNLKIIINRIDQRMECKELIEPLYYFKCGYYVCQST